MIVIPMAGLSRRFRESGYDRPKYMLELDGRSLFARSVEGFAPRFGREPFLFVARGEAGTAGFIQRECEVLGIVDPRVVILDAPTGGQADTVRLGLRRTDTAADEPLTIFNIDTFRPGGELLEAAALEAADGCLEVMEADDPGFSFARPAPGDAEARIGAVVETAEKRVISNLASTGLYWFRRADEFLRLVDAARADEAGELYVAPLYNDLIAQGGIVRFQRTHPDAIRFCGTPDQYRRLGGRAPEEL